MHALFTRIAHAIKECEVLGYERAPEVWDDLRLGELPIKQWGPMVFSAPVLYPEECDCVVATADRLKGDFAVNHEEGKDYQIPELIIADYDETLYANCGLVAWARIAPLFELMTGSKPTLESSIQLARYTPENTAQTGWHIDLESEFTCVVSLAPTRHQGGGTLLRPYGPAGGTIRVPPLPKGHGLFFNGRYVHHRGAPVTEGERLLLVYWLMGGRK